MAVSVMLALWIAPTSAYTTEIADHAEQLFRQGRRAFLQGRDAAAQALFERSLGYHQVRNAYWNLAASHLSQGHRDLTVWALDRYMRLNPPYIESAEMQAAVGAIADSPEPIEDIDRRGELAEQVDEAAGSVMEGRSTPVDEAERRFGTGSPGAEAERAQTTSYDQTKEFFIRGHELFGEGEIQRAMVLFERSLAYKPARNALWNIAACHLALGHRDFALHFIDGYLNATPLARKDTGVQAVVGAIADEPPNVPNVDRRYELWDELATATNAALGEEKPETDGGES